MSASRDFCKDRSSFSPWRPSLPRLSGGWKWAAPCRSSTDSDRPPPERQPASAVVVLASHIEKIRIVRKAQEARRQLAPAALAVDLRHALDQVLHEDLPILANISGEIAVLE